MTSEEEKIKHQTNNGSDDIRGGNKTVKEYNDESADNLSYIKHSLL